MGKFAYHSSTGSLLIQFLHFRQNIFSVCEHNSFLFSFNNVTLESVEAEAVKRQTADSSTSQTAELGLNNTTEPEAEEAAEACADQATQHYAVGALQLNHGDDR